MGLSGYRGVADRISLQGCVSREDAHFPGLGATQAPRLSQDPPVLHTLCIPLVCGLHLVP